MSINIIIKSRKSEDERLSQENAQKILKHEYDQECAVGSGSHDQREHTKSQIKRAWEHDAKGEDDPHFKRYDESSKRAAELANRLAEQE